VGIIGREGVTGLSVVLDGDSNRRPRHETFMQIGGSGQRISVEDLREAIAASTALHRVLLRYSYGYLMQTAQTALSNGCSKIEERLVS
jgi:hypothetical protein